MANIPARLAIIAAYKAVLGEIAYKTPNKAKTLACWVTFSDKSKLVSFLGIPDSLTCQLFANQVKPVLLGNPFSLSANQGIVARKPTTMKNPKVAITVHLILWLSFGAALTSWAKETDKILVTGLKKEDYDNIDFSKKSKIAPDYWGQTEYLFEAKNKKWSDKIFPTYYHAISELKPEEIEEKLAAQQKKNPRLRKANFSGSSLDSPSVRFKNIGGLYEAKEELQEIPGNGKTLLAKALAGEWAADIRNTFATARKYAKEKGGCFIFVDEIDAIAGKRQHSISSHHETLNQLLNELDGFSPRENVIFLAATNSLMTAG
ncbi:3685_t:CDS:2, partial [Funneliformis geosporum]